MLSSMAPVSSVAFTSYDAVRLLRLVDTAGPVRTPAFRPMCLRGNGCNRTITLVSLVKEWSHRTQSQSSRRNVGLTEGNKCDLHSAHLWWVMLRG